MTTADDVVFELVGLGGDGIRVVVAPTAEAGPLLPTTIQVTAHPFAGTFGTTSLAADIAEWRAAAARLADSVSVVVGGGRAPEVRLERDGEVTEVTVTPSGDDPWPVLRFLIFPHT